MAVKLEHTMYSAIDGNILSVMTDVPLNLDTVLNTYSWQSCEPTSMIDHFGTLVDAADAAQRIDVLKHLAHLGSTIRVKDAPDYERTNLDYYFANVWGALQHLRGSHAGGDWEWEQHELEQQTIHLRRAWHSPGMKALPLGRALQIATNLGNCYSTTGRFIEAMHMWRFVLGIVPEFGMARGNRAVCLWNASRTLYDPKHQALFIREAWRELSPDGLHDLEPGIGTIFESVRQEIEQAIPREVLEQTFDLTKPFSLGKTKQEIAYRQWCLEEFLFLNPLNDLASLTVAAQDVLTAPSIVMPVKQGPRYHGFFNQIKQAYCSARWLAYQGIHDTRPHFSDRDVLTYDTLDSPSHSLATEHLRLSFRSLYSLFDQIAFFLNAYLELGIKETLVSFSGLWYSGQKRQHGLRPEFQSKQNWPLRGLYWVSKDLYEPSQAFRGAIDPDAERLRVVRNHLEHKYLKLHGHLWRGPPEAGVERQFVDNLAYSMHREDFVWMTKRLLSLARAAITYLSLGVHLDEQQRARVRPDNVVSIPIRLDTLDYKKHGPWNV